uniref:long-chain-fatty-acid--CoA ligase n=1 Tax=Amazona collaria TaxID=241587 RepID=A0A8B9FMP2_9PSIT
EGRAWLWLLPALGARRGCWLSLSRLGRELRLWDLRFALTMVRVARKARRAGARQPAQTLLDVFTRRARLTPHKRMLLFGDKMSTYEQVERRRGCLALLMGNQPAYVWVWLGCAKLGCAVACLSSSIRATSLLRCFQSCAATVVSLLGVIYCKDAKILPFLKKENVKVYYLSKTSATEGVESFLDKVDAASDEPTLLSWRLDVTCETPAIYIYTSGTTGNTNSQKQTTRSSHHCVFLKFDTVLQYNKNCSISYLFTSFYTGVTIVLHARFSASQFWDDCRKYNVTVIQYIGEVLQYLCSVSQRNNDQDHKVRLAIGNGIRADVWREFVRRFGNTNILEFYASTEGNISFVNYAGKVGAVGRVNYFPQLHYELIKYDVKKDEPVQDENGYCIKVPKGTSGLLICKITQYAPFSGYAGAKQQTGKKQLRDVFQKADLYFNSSDLLVIDNDNFIYFHDRIGDTFRLVYLFQWENVSTMEAEDILGLTDCVQEVIVYGVSVPGYEGRTGMACIRLKENSEFNAGSTYRHVKTHLPNYARPRFIRIKSAIELTATFKYRKVQLMEESFNSAVIKDRLYFLDDRENLYVQMTEDIYNSVKKHDLKL